MWCNIIVTYSTTTVVLRIEEKKKSLYHISVIFYFNQDRKKWNCQPANTRGLHKPSKKLVPLNNKVKLAYVSLESK